MTTPARSSAVWSDGCFHIGVNLPWLRYGCDVGANAWQPDGGVGDVGARLRLRDALARIRDTGARIVRWFLLCDGRAGLREHEDGTLAGLDDFVDRDIDAAVEELDRAGLLAIFVLLDFGWCSPAHTVNGVRLGGRTSVLATPRGRASLTENVLAPLLARYGRHSAIAAWDVMNEPEWVTRRTGSVFRRGAISRAGMRTFIADVTALIHTHTSHAATVGLASASALNLVRGLDLDLYQIHWYDAHELHTPLDRQVSSFALDRPLLLGEFPTSGSQRSPQTIVETAGRNGFAGALAWSALSTDEASDATLLADVRWETGIRDTTRPSSS